MQNLSFKSVTDFDKKKFINTTISIDQDLIVNNQEKYSEKIIQFGTGAFLRGFIDFFVDNANTVYGYKGKIVAIESSGSGRGETLNDQDGLFTLCIEGFSDGKIIQDIYINSAVSRVLSAKNNWSEILKTAENPNLELVVSNTTEIGIQYQVENFDGQTPQSFPGKLLMILKHRFEFFKGDISKGLVIIPCELLINNADLLKSILVKHINEHNFDLNFLSWINNSCEFCNSLVDRIVPGSPDNIKKISLESKLGYTDKMMTIAEVYRFWAIEHSNPEKLIQKLPFLKSDEGIIVSNNISPFRERKLRLLNGSHTISVALAYLCGIRNVEEMMKNEQMFHFLTKVVYNEIIPATDIPYEMASAFAKDVFDRFKNPFLNHQLLSITLQYSMKMKMRNLALIENYTKLNGKAPQMLALGFAAYLVFSKSTKEIDGKMYGTNSQNEDYLIQDDSINTLNKHWKLHNISESVKAICEDETLWGSTLSTNQEFILLVINHVTNLLTSNPKSYLQNILN